MPLPGRESNRPPCYNHTSSQPRNQGIGGGRLTMFSNCCPRIWSNAFDDSISTADFQAIDPREGEAGERHGNLSKVSSLESELAINRDRVKRMTRSIWYLIEEILRRTSLIYRVSGPRYQVYTPDTRPSVRPCVCIYVCDARHSHGLLVYHWWVASDSSLFRAFSSSSVDCRLQNVH